MPIFQADLEHAAAQHAAPEPIDIDIGRPGSRDRRLSEESLRTELCEGPVPDSPLRSPPLQQPGADDGAAISDRAELIERLKRGESPTWIPNRRLESILQHGTSPVPPRRTRTPSSDSPNLLPPAQITPERDDASPSADERLLDGLDIERPRSALHSGDFTHEEAHSVHREDEERQVRDAGRPGKLDRNHLDDDSSWIATSPPRDFAPFRFGRRIPIPPTVIDDPKPGSSSPLSSSLSSSFVYQLPTSPLVQSESNEDLELAMSLRGIGIPHDRPFPRRHTVATNASSPLASPPARASIPGRVPLHHRREGSLPYQAHQPRRSLTSTPAGGFSQLPGSSPQTPAFLRSRRQSFGSDSSPLQHASMVGSYEESILRGRMSTTPSRPLDFLAQIGVLGMGKCKPSLKCPPHVTLPFSAVYYSYSSTPHGRSRSDDGPSPYVGQIDMENGLPNVAEESRSRRKAQSRYAERSQPDADVDAVMAGQYDADAENRRASRPGRRSGSPKAPPGGSYRIPEKGQIQIIIKNQNKTAVKLFLVPYDLAGMEPGTKTFIRQRSYSAGPIMDLPSSPSPGILGGPDPGDRPVLRYLVHLHICSPARGRFYLYKSIRIVFANRVPDGKERLRNETTWPEPRFTPYKPIRVMHPPLSAAGPGGAGHALAAEKAFRRRSSGFSLPPTSSSSASHAFDLADGLGPMPGTPLLATARRPSAGGAASFGFGFGLGGGNTLPVDPIPFRVPARDRRPQSSETSETASATATLSRPSTKDDPASPPAGPWGAARYEKLSKGDLGYGGNAFAPAPGAGVSGGGAEGLLSQRLRSLGVKTTSENSPPDRGDSGSS